jgi:membrane associated rhomboid family serine protease
MNTVALIILIITGGLSMLCFSNVEMMQKLQMWPYRIKRNKEEIYRMLTSGFIHADTMHLAINMITYYFFADILISVIGEKQFVILYLSGIIIANIPSLIKHADNPYRAAIGASGGVASLVFATIYLAPWQMIYLFGIIPLPSIIFAVLYIVYSYKMKDDQKSNIGHEAHLWGAIYGLVFMAAVVDPTHGLNFIENIKDIPYFK